MQHETFPFSLFLWFLQPYYYRIYLRTLSQISFPFFKEVTNHEVLNNKDKQVYHQKTFILLKGADCYKIFLLFRISRDALVFTQFLIDFLSQAFCLLVQKSIFLSPHFFYKVHVAFVKLNSREYILYLSFKKEMVYQN